MGASPGNRFASVESPASLPEPNRALQTDDDRIAIQRLLAHLLAKSIKSDGTGGRVLETDLVGFGNEEVRCDKAELGTEHDPGITEALRVLAIEPEGRARIRLAAATEPRSGSRSQILMRSHGTT